MELLSSPRQPGILHASLSEVEASWPEWREVGSEEWGIYFIPSLHNSPTTIFACIRDEYRQEPPCFRRHLVGRPTFVLQPMPNFSYCTMIDIFEELGACQLNDAERCTPVLVIWA